MDAATRNTTRERIREASDYIYANADPAYGIPDAIMEAADDLWASLERHRIEKAISVAQLEIDKLNARLAEIGTRRATPTTPAP